MGDIGNFINIFISELNEWCFGIVIIIFCISVVASGSIPHVTATIATFLAHKEVRRPLACQVECQFFLVDTEREGEQVSQGVFLLASVSGRGGETIGGGWGNERE